MSELSNVLLINRDDIMTWTGLSGNLDTDKLIPHVATATEVHLQPILGTDLLDKCRTLVKDDELGDAGNEAYETLVVSYVAPVLVFYTMWDMMPFLTYQIANGGIFQHQSENSVSPDTDTMNMLIQKFKDKGEFYGNRLNDYLCNNSSSYSELYTNSNGDINSLNDQTFHGWEL